MEEKEKTISGSTSEQVFEIEKIVAQNEKETLRTLHNQLFVHNASVITILFLSLNKIIDLKFYTFALITLVPIFLHGLSIVLVLASYKVGHELYIDEANAENINIKAKKLSDIGWICFIAGVITTFVLLVCGLFLIKQSSQIKSFFELMLNI